MKAFQNGNWGLKILSLVLAILIYHALKSGAVRDNGKNSNHDRHFFQSR